MKLILLAGPQAVGKMTVGQELAKCTELKLFHNHQTIDLLLPLLPLNEAGWETVRQLREIIFRAFAKSGQYGMIHTVMFDYPDDFEYWEWIKNCFREECPETQFYFVELRADMEERLRRNKTENRLLHKPSKRDLEWSENDLRTAMEKHRLYSEPGEITEPNYLCLDTTHLSAEETAQIIKARFQL